MIKVLYLPLNFGSCVFTGVYDAFRDAGVNLEIFDYFYYYMNNRKNIVSVRRKLLDKAKSFQPDLIHMQIQHTTIINEDTVRQLKLICPKAKIVNYTIDIRNYIQPTYLAAAKHADFNLITSTGQIDMYKRAGIKNVKYWQVGYDPKNHYPEPIVRKNFDFDVCFVANVNTKENYPGHKERMETAYKLRSVFGQRFGLFGWGWPKNIRCLPSMDIKDSTKQVYHKSFCTLSISHFNQIEHYFSDRLLMCLASGRPTISWNFPKFDSYFNDGSDLLIANNTNDVINKVKYLLDNPDKANFIGMNGAAKVFAEHSYLSRINELLEIVGLK